MSLLQLLDVCLSKLFKNEMRKLWSDWMTEGIGIQYTHQDNLKIGCGAPIIRKLFGIYDSILSL